jgi:hypothetical protein
LEKGVRGIDQISNELRKNFVSVNKVGVSFKTQIIHPNFEIHPSIDKYKGMADDSK